MKNFFLLLSLATVLISCGVKVPYTTQIRDEFTLDTDEKIRQVQFYTSHTIILNQEKRDDSQNTTQNGTLVSSSSSERETVVIPALTTCVFEGFGPKGEVIVRFEVGDGKILTFATKTEGSSIKRYYFDADWNSQGGPKINYGENTYKVDLMRGAPRAAHLLVVKKRLQKTKRKERVVRGLKV
ncbi:MAG: hypothetical protein RLZZ243_482 [Bacteroidota bacterium]|jgi:hypothetical protein